MPILMILLSWRKKTFNQTIKKKTNKYISTTGYNVTVWLMLMFGTIIYYFETRILIYFFSKYYTLHKYVNFKGLSSNVAYYLISIFLQYKWILVGRYQKYKH